MKQDTRRIRELVSVGKATLGDLERLGVRSMEQLSASDPEELYERISVLDGQRHDPCVLDVFRAAVAQARDPELPGEQRQWWYWSRQRTRSAANQAARRRSPSSIDTAGS